MISRKFLALCLIFTLIIPMIGSASFAASEMFNVQTYGAAGDGITDDTASVQNAINAANSEGGGNVFFPKGTYKISYALTLYSNVNLSGVGMGSKIFSTQTSGEMIIINQISNITVDNLYFEGNAAVTALNLTQSSAVTVKHCGAVASSLISANESLSYSSVTDSSMCSKINVLDNTSYGSGTSAGNPCISLYYTNNALISGNKIENYRVGISLYGGNSNVDGALSNPRKSKDIIVTGNTVISTGLFGISASMLEKSVIQSNTVSNSSGYGINVEGSFHISVNGNTGNNCTGAVIKAGYMNKGLVISGNSLYSDVDGQRLIYINNPTQSTDNKDILICANSFYHTGTGLGVVYGETCSIINVTGNQFVNVRLSVAFNNDRYTKISGNTLTFVNTASSAFNAIWAGSTHNYGKCTVENNIITSNVSQPTGSRGIYVSQSDYNTDPVTVINGNNISGFAIDIGVLSDSPNTGRMPRFLVTDNCLGNGNFQRTEGTTQKSYVILTDNFLPNGTNFPAAIPSSGKWDVGQKIYYNSPTAGGYIGAVCVTGGNPGVWKEFGAISN